MTGAMLRQSEKQNAKLIAEKTDYLIITTSDITIHIITMEEAIMADLTNTAITMAGDGN